MFDDAKGVIMSCKNRRIDKLIEGHIIQVNGQNKRTKGLIMVDITVHRIQYIEKHELHQKKGGKLR